MKPAQLVAETIAARDEFAAARAIGDEDRQIYLDLAPEVEADFNGLTQARGEVVPYGKLTLQNQVSPNRVFDAVYIEQCEVRGVEMSLFVQPRVHVDHTGWTSYELAAWLLPDRESGKGRHLNTHNAEYGGRLSFEVDAEPTGTGLSKLRGFQDLLRHVIDAAALEDASEQDFAHLGTTLKS